MFLSLCPQLLQCWKLKKKILKMEKVNFYFFANMKGNLWESNNELLLKIYITTMYMGLA